jgi:hypothetical protein
MNKLLFILSVLLILALPTYATEPIRPIEGTITKISAVYKNMSFPSLPCLIAYRQKAKNIQISE